MHHISADTAPDTFLQVAIPPGLSMKYRQIPQWDFAIPFE
jgi:hypothetical protein